jgi:predicted esterase
MIGIMALAFLTSCASVVREMNQQELSEIYGLERVVVKGGDFFLTTYQKISNRNLPYVFYIEGDGAAFNGKYKVSANPTPKRQMLIKLAAMDDRPNVIYIARPCQYTQMSYNPLCTYDTSFWTNKRLSEEVIYSVDEVIKKINFHGLKYSIVGFSGGGAVAVLVAARNPYSVKDIITVAGNLDIDSFVAYHRVSPMIGSINPITYVGQVQHIPQLHLSGGQDKIVTPLIADKFIQAASEKNCMQQKIFENVDHTHGWDKVWDFVLKMPIYCN